VPEGLLLVYGLEDFVALSTCRLTLGAWLIFAGALSNPPAFAGPVAYTLSFTSTVGTAPSSGSFTYDAAVPEFTDFLVVWEGAGFDFTAWANQPSTSGHDPICLDSTALITFKLLSGECSNAPIWDFFSQSSPFGGPAAGFFSIHGDNQPRTPFIYGDPGFPLFGGPPAYGGLSIIQTDSSAPEPGTAALLLVAALAWGGIQRMRRNQFARPTNRPAAQFPLTQITKLDCLPR
jgi:hypothetical protein